MEPENHDGPVTMLRSWLDDARAAGDPDVDAMALATSTPDGVPSVRTVLLTGLDERGLQFHSSAGTRKVDELRANPQASVVLRWARTARQVVVSGPVVELSAPDNDRSFANRPRELQLLGWLYELAGPTTGGDAPELDAVYDELGVRFATGDIPRPPSWTGFRLQPRTVEFWQRGRAGAANSRIGFTVASSGPGDGTAFDGWSRRRMLP